MSYFDRCSRLGLTSLAYLWQRDQNELLEEMKSCGLESAIIKVAGAGLTLKHLGKSVTSQEMMSDLSKLEERCGLHPCGEGGEYETFTTDCPLFHRKLDL